LTLRNELERMEREKEAAKPKAPPEPKQPEKPATPEPSPGPSSQSPSPGGTRSLGKETSSKAPLRPISVPSPEVRSPGLELSPAETREAPVPMQRAEIVIPGARHHPASKPEPAPQAADLASPEVKIETQREPDAPAAKSPPQTVKSAPPINVQTHRPETPRTDQASLVAAKPQRWMVQVGSFPSPTEAQQLANQLRQRGYDAYLIKAEVGAKTWYRVRVGRLNNEGEALELQQRLKTVEKIDQSVVFTQ
jgi:cell division septation protein DedD